MDLVGRADLRPLVGAGNARLLPRGHHGRDRGVAAETAAKVSVERVKRLETEFF